jgi:hypothetical protein
MSLEQDEAERKKLEAEWKKASSAGNEMARRQAIKTWGGILLAGLIGFAYVVLRVFGRRRRY